MGMPPKMVKIGDKITFMQGYIDNDRLSPRGRTDPNKNVIHFQMVPERVFTSLGLCKGM